MALVPSQVFFVAERDGVDERHDRDDEHAEENRVESLFGRALFERRTDRPQIEQHAHGEQHRPEQQHVPKTREHIDGEKQDEQRDARQEEPFVFEQFRDRLHGPTSTARFPRRAWRGRGKAK
ncbi:MAG: hypothetical protein M5R36_30055 [Deltaproteobacteria bacterium]|nr:hypothetical protein [Deltaproteobacteria bacterium]